MYGVEPPLLDAWYKWVLTIKTEFAVRTLDTYDPQKYERIFAKIMCMAEQLITESNELTRLWRVADVSNTDKRHLINLSDWAARRHADLLRLLDEIEAIDDMDARSAGAK